MSSIAASRSAAAPARVLLRLRQYRQTAVMEAAGLTGDSYLFLIDYLLRFLRVVLLLSLWRMILSGKGTVSGMTLGSVLTYTLIAEVFAEAFTPRTDLEWTLRDGSIATRYLRPMGLFGQFSCQMLGRFSLSFVLFSLPLLLVSPWLGVNPLPASASSAALFPVSLVLAVAVGLAIEFLFCGIMVVLDLDVYTINRVRGAVGMLLSGALLPLPLLPWGIGRVFTWLPFAAAASAPLRIYTVTGSPALLMALQAGWALALWPAAYWLWARSREKIVCQGG